MVNEVKFTLAMDGGTAVITDLDGVGKKLVDINTKLKDASGGADAFGGSMRTVGSQLKGFGDASASAALAAVDANNKIGMSARAMSSALRGVPAQFTDIVVSLQAGQAPLTVLMQQGGQLKDMFGGVGNAAKALGGYVFGLINPFTVTAAAAVTLAVAYSQGSKEAQEYSKALLMTGNAAGTTVGQLQAMAADVSATTGATQGAAAEALTAFANSANIASADYERFAGVAIKVQKETGVAVAETAAKFSELGKAPLEASIKLNDSMHYLTAEVYKQIKALEEHGDKVSAAALAQKAYADASEKAMAGLTANLGTAEKAWRSITGSAKDAWDTMLGVGRKESIGDKIALTAKSIAEIQSKAGPDGSVSLWEGGGKLESLKGQLSYLVAIKNSQDALANGDAKRAALQIDLQNFDAKSIEFLSKKQKLDKEITLAQVEGERLITAGLIDRKQLETQLANIRDKYKETSKKTGDEFASQRAAAKEWASFYEEFNDLEAKAAGRVGELTKAQVELVKYLESPAYTNMAEPARQLILQSAYAAITQEKLGKEIAAVNKENEAATTAYTQLTASQDKRTKSVEEELQKQLEHNAAIGVTVEAAGALEAANLVARADALDRKADLADLIYLDGQYADSLRKESEALRKLGKEKQVGATKKAADEAFKEWQKTADKINDSITDALMRGFENGKPLAENLRDTVANMFKTLVLRPVISAIVNPVTQGITGSFQTAGSSMLGSAAGSLGAGSLFTAAGMSALGESFGASAMATLTGSSFSNAAVVGQFAGGGAAGTGIASTLGAAMPYIAAAVIAYNLLNQDHGTPTRGTGEASANYDKYGQRIGVNSFEPWGGMSSSAGAAITRMQTDYANVSKALGVGMVDTQFAYGSNTGKDSQGNNFAIGSRAGASSYSTGGEQAYSDAAFSLAASRAVFAALQGSELPQYLAKVFDGLSAGALSQDQITGTLAYAQSLKSVREALLETREPLQILKDNVEQGFATLATSADTFKADFVAAIDAGITPDKLAQWQGLQTAMTDLAATSGKATDSVQAANHALLDQAKAAKDAAEAWQSANSALESSRQSVAGAYKSIQDAADQAAIAVSNEQDKITTAYLDAQDAVAAAQDEIANVSMQAGQALLGFAKQIRDFTGAIDRSSAGGLNGPGQFAASQADFAITLAQARAGDKDAMGRITGIARDMLDIGKEQATSAVDYRRLVSVTKGALDGLAASTEAANASASAVEPMVAAQDKLLKANEKLALWAKAAIDSGATTSKPVVDNLADWRKANEQYVLAKTNLATADDLTKGLDLALKTPLQNLADAVASLALAMVGQRTAASAAGSSVPPSVSSAALTEQVIRQQLDGTYASVSGAAKNGDLWKSAGGAVARMEGDSINVYGASGGSMTVEAIRAWVSQQTDMLEVYKGAIANGISSATLEAIMGVPKGTANYWAVRNGLPKFAGGGTHSGGWAMVGEQGPELAYMPPARIYTAGQSAQMMGNTERLERLVEGLTAEVQRLQAVVRDGNDNTRQLAEQFDQVTEGGNAARMVAV